MTALADIFPVRFGGYWGKEPDAADVNMRAVRNGDVGTTGEVHWEKVPTRSFTRREAAKATLQCGDILLTSSGNCGNVAFISDNPVVPTAATNFIRVLRVNSDSTSPRFVFHYLRSDRFKLGIAPFIRGATIKNLSVEAALRSLKVRFPPLDEQRRIAAILDHADALRANRRQVLAHLDSLVPSVLHKLLRTGFGRVALGELIVEGPKNGLYRPSSDYGSGTPIVRIDSFKSGSSVIEIDSLKRLRASNGQIAEFALAPGDLLVNRVNSREHVGKAALVSDLGEQTVFESNIMRIRLDHERILPIFAAEFMQSRDARAQIAPMTKDAVNQSSINQTDVRNIQVPLPPLDQQYKFATIVRAVAAERAAILRSIAGIDELYNALQSRAFRGEL
ncbi:restriction endonuclease subunit S [Brachybacterium sp. GCM10030268]|uniref:restriction endonuclease subunit S n=1 Tax=Brachybacterium sp. GCM10030268 TaxID=3273382 RepID=UPI00360D478F